MSKLGMGLLGLFCVVNAAWLLYEHPPTSVFNFWPLVLLNLVGFLFSLTAFFKVGLRRAAPASKDPTSRAPASGEPGLAEEKVG